MSNADRASALARFRDEYGCGQQDAALAARALIPFDDNPAPGQALAGEGERLALQFGKEIVGLRGNEVAVTAERFIEEFLDLARDHRDMHYVTLFEDVLEHASGPVAGPESGE